MLGVEVDERPRFGLTGDHEAEVLVEEHRHQQWRRVIGVDRTVIDELADAAALHHSVVIALDQFGLGHQFAAGGVVPTRLRVVLPLDQPGGPGEFEHAGGRQLAIDLHLEAGA